MEMIYIVKGFSQLICETVNNSTWAVCTLKLKSSLRICQEVNLETSALLCQEAWNPPWHMQMFCNSKPKSKACASGTISALLTMKGSAEMLQNQGREAEAKVFFQDLGLLTVGGNWINHSSTRTDYFFLSPLS